MTVRCCLAGSIVVVLAATGAVIAGPPLAADAEGLKPHLQLWLRADRLAYRDGQPVHHWPDSSGKANDLAATKGARSGGVGLPPTFVANSRLNGRPAVRFVPASGLGGSPDRPLDIHGDAALTIFLVAVLEPNDGKSPYDGVLCIGNPGPGKDPGRARAALIEIERTDPKRHQLDLAGGFSHDASLGPGSMQPLYNRPLLLSITRRAGPWAAGTTFHIDGQPPFERSVVATGRGNEVPRIEHRSEIGTWMGGAIATAGGFRGDVAEVIVYNRALSDEQRAGIEAGLAARHGLILAGQLEALAGNFSDEQRSFWSFQPVERPSLPAVAAADWPTSPIDHFVLARLEAARLAPSPPVDRRTLGRRLVWDLTGLPPTPEQLARFLADVRPGAVGRLVDRLLASPHYGERWGRRWLDVVRFAETTASDGNFVMKYAWRYRDWVVESLNRDLRYDQFVQHQLAGDLLPRTDDPSENAGRVIATGFLMLGPKELAEADKEQTLLNIADENIDVTGRAFLGLTIACARCHDHKFDPIPTADYYSLAGIFRSTEVLGDRVRNATKWMEFEYDPGGGAPKLVVMAPKETTPVNLPIHIRGDRFDLGPIAPRRFLQILDGETAPPLRTTGSGRLELARWIARADNPLFARVMVNRLWQGHFGRGLVGSSDNFGQLGERPTHPRLLDWLADEFVHGGWSIKAMHRAMLLTSTYRMSSRRIGRGEEVDPENRMLWRMPRKRLEAEQVRDGLFAVAGTLDRRIGGGDAIEAVFAKSDAVAKDRELVSAGTLNSHYEGFDVPRRSLYLPVIRNGLPDVLALFDAADANAVTAARGDSTVPSQSLFLMNNKLVRDQAEALGRRLLAETPASDEERIDRAMRLVCGRPADPIDLREALVFLDRYTKTAITANSPPADARLAAWRCYCQVLLCSNEFLYVD